MKKSFKNRPPAIHLDRRNAVRMLGAVPMAALIALPARAQNFPSRRLTMVLPGGPGATSDLIGRHLGAAIAKQTGLPVVPDNKPGANGIIGVQTVMNAPADGYTVLLTTVSTMAINKPLYKALPYDPVNDFVPVGIMIRAKHFVVVNPKLPFTTAEQLLAAARKEPGKLNFGYASSYPQLAGKLLEQMSGAQFSFVPYKTQDGVKTAVISGEIDVTITGSGDMGQNVKANQVRALAATSATRIEGFLDIPTLTESVLPGYEVVGWHGAFVRKGTPPEAVSRLSELMKAAMDSPDLRKYLDTNGLDTFFVPAQDCPAYMKSEIEKYTTIVRKAGIEPM